ncbi:hypothetical protein TSUD_29090 [Trifolium subterraneum]|uniref:Uncharacterized protein n=1 Tax=Trifolium subterraneum TaxID=3900 RepID=A0A2Z6MXI1_TRISU|nr:hypothetical protein TSUD_29090 [Trifolium subterraneum]
MAVGWPERNQGPKGAIVSMINAWFAELLSGISSLTGLYGCWWLFDLRLGDSVTLVGFSDVVVVVGDGRLWEEGSKKGER